MLVYREWGISTGAPMDQTNKQPNPDTGSVAPSTIQLLSDLGLLIDSTRQRVARTVNAELVLTRRSRNQTGGAMISEWGANS